MNQQTLKAQDREAMLQQEAQLEAIHGGRLECFRYALYFMTFVLRADPSVQVWKLGKTINKPSGRFAGRNPDWKCATTYLWGFYSADAQDACERFGLTLTRQHSGLPEGVAWEDSPLGHMNDGTTELRGVNVLKDARYANAIVDLYNDVGVPLIVNGRAVAVAENPADVEAFPDSDRKIKKHGAHAQWVDEEYVPKPRSQKYNRWSGELLD